MPYQVAIAAADSKTHLQMRLVRVRDAVAVILFFKSARGHAAETSDSAKKASMHHRI